MEDFDELDDLARLEAIVKELGGIIGYELEDDCALVRALVLDSESLHETMPLKPGMVVLTIFDFQGPETTRLCQVRVKLQELALLVAEQVPLPDSG